MTHKLDSTELFKELDIKVNEAEILWNKDNNDINYSINKGFSLYLQLGYFL